MADLEKITKKRLGELLVAEGMISQDQLAEALKMQERSGELLGESLVKAGFTTETEIAKTLCTQFAKPFLKPSRYDIAKDVLSLVPPKLMAEHQFIPVDRFGNLLVIAMSGLLDATALASIQKLTGCEIEVYITTASDLKLALRKTFPDLYDPITLMPKFDLTGAVTMGVARSAVAAAGTAPATPGGPPPKTGRPDLALGLQRPRKAPGSPMGEVTSEIAALGRAENEGDWEALFEEAEQKVMNNLNPQDSAPRELKPPPPKGKRPGP